MSSLNSQESSNDICRLTDKQQAEYRDAYREYISQMSQLEMAGSGAERPHPGQFAQAGSSEDKSVGGQCFFFPRSITSAFRRRDFLVKVSHLLLRKLLCV